MCLPPTSNFASDVYLTGCDVDWGAEALFASKLDLAGIFLDVGADIGYYTLYMYPRVAGVIAFEPDPRNLSWLRTNVKSYPNVEIVEQPVFRDVRTISFRLGPNSEESAIASTPKTTDCVDMQTVTLDSIWAGRNRPRVTGIKIDVEGSDFEVLSGAANLVDEDQPLILTELNRRDDIPRLSEWVSERDYQLFAYVRSHPRRARLEAVSASSRDHWKMLFLVPRRLQLEFHELAAN